MAVINCISSAGVAKPGQRRRSVLFQDRWRDSAMLRMKESNSDWSATTIFPTTLFLRDSWVQIPPPALQSYHDKYNASRNHIMKSFDYLFSKMNLILNSLG